MPSGPSHLARTLTGHAGWVNAVASSPDKCLLAAVSDDDDRTVRVRQQDTGCRGAAFSACRPRARLSGSGTGCTGAPMRSRLTTT
jgi:hypothetical protein